MDPNETLAVLLQRARKVRQMADTEETHELYEGVMTLAAPEMARLLLDLDEWITKGGFLPARWEGARK